MSSINSCALAFYTVGDQRRYQAAEGCTEGETNEALGQAIDAWKGAQSASHSSGVPFTRHSKDGNGNSLADLTGMVLQFANQLDESRAISDAHEIHAPLE